MRQTIKTQKINGSAIIVALFIVALIAAIAVAMIQRLQIDTRRTALILQANQAYFYTQGSIAWAKVQLNKSWEQQKPNRPVDNPSPVIFPTVKETPYTISSSLMDSQGLFNINNLSDDQYSPVFIKLIRTLSPNINDAAAKELVKAAKDWITPGLKETQYDAYYLKLNPPYRSAHVPMVSMSELLLVKGITPDLFSKLAPYITALPQPTPININSAPIPVLMSLSPSLQLDTARQIAALVQRTPFADTQKFLSQDMIKNNPISSSLITVTSNYFLLETNVTVEENQTKIYALLNRVAKDKKSNVYVVWQSKGTL